VGGTPEALYVDTIEFANGTGQIGLSGLHLYYNTLVGDSGQINPLDCARSPASDFDRDGDVDGDDVGWFQDCAAGPAIPLAAGCEKADLDGDGDGDQADYGTVQRCVSGAGKPAAAHCAD